MGKQQYIKHLNFILVNIDDDWSLKIEGYSWIGD